MTEHSFNKRNRQQGRDTLNRFETDKGSDVASLQENFEERRFDADGVREVVVIGNERVGGCPFKCPGCGVHEEAAKVDASANAQKIVKQIEGLQCRIQANSTVYEESGYHICIYNFGNVTNTEELSVSNLELLLQKLNELVPSPKYVSLNSRGRFINEQVLARLKGLGLKYTIHFILGVESLGEKGSKIYGKPQIQSEVANMFATINKFNEENNSRFGVDAGFVFLPEFYTADRADKEAIANGFLSDVGGFIEKNVGQKTPVRINIHPFYEMPEKMPYASTAPYFDILMKAMMKLENIVKLKNESLPEHLRISFFIGLNDSGYETLEWKQAKAKWQRDIDRINRGA
ncbi:MAG: hypothetical protein A2233_02750 [Candidatus Kerfeldbacteria bacterium RIFOXYA2_FULL_38_24]|uniref:Elp3/MiaA/NifB-like radical SAM core domain-containing protein n=1 Tax=Candidatus Kerfeldbacteria bacterium RIFOXYB2_FULL_38_14 TaxID=1798547 RepID=A0A1G2BD81_9BACT|nr:MAG: hypothetical protein A2233_02750 [Candidatus Kerfeldbacteria bacterium RIFOXYA2_FULL_38_24]OGY87101.1 MAG: hypothetical protein A2319_02760 [Candidatus Kerfeldbacteria bacterium RIFOXYB2_FULL_38_14]OGY88527.1 MAG: hypothetical protein A2458_05240 [Candidatus Kerfeldbacteria bacterium RIFOXYC2_FULL_38_9]